MDFSLLRNNANQFWKCGKIKKPILNIDGVKSHTKTEHIKVENTD